MLEFVLDIAKHAFSMFADALEHYPLVTAAVMMATLALMDELNIVKFVEFGRLKEDYEISDYVKIIICSVLAIIVSDVAGKLFGWVFSLLHLSGSQFLKHPLDFTSIFAVLCLLAMSYMLLSERERLFRANPWKAVSLAFVVVLLTNVITPIFAAIVGGTSPPLADAKPKTPETRK